MSEAIGRFITSLRRLNLVRRLRVILTPSPIPGGCNDKETTMNQRAEIGDVVAKVGSTFAMDLCNTTATVQIKPDEKRYTLATMANWQPQGLPKEEFAPTLAAIGNNAQALIALYDAHWAAARAMLSIENEPRSKDVQGFLEDEYCRLVERAHAIGAKLAAMPQVDHWQAESRVQTIFNCGIEMGWDLPDALAVATEAAATPQIPHKD
jgi:hypothetical protein